MIPFLASRYEAKASQPERAVAVFDRFGFCIVRSLLAEAVARRIAHRFDDNLAGLGALFPNYQADALLSPFSLAIPFSEGDATLADRLAATAPGLLAQLALSVLSVEELTRFESEVGWMTALPLFAPFHARVAKGRLVWSDRYSYCRWEKWRPNTTEVTAWWKHQDAAYDLFPDGGLTVWVALCDCGNDAPGLELLPRRFAGKIAHKDDPAATFIADDQFPRRAWLRPRFRPGDAVLIDPWTIHGTHALPTMPRHRGSLELRLVPA